MPYPWLQTAAYYAREMGWRVLPLHPNRGQLGEKATILEDHLQHKLLMMPQDASGDPNEILAWDVHGAHRIGLVTGSGSNLIGLEVEGVTSFHELKAKAEPLLGPLPKTRCIEGGDRCYLLFRYPDQAESLPRMRRKRRLVLHGEESVIQVPLMTGEENLREYFVWSLRGDQDEVAGAPQSLLSHFGIRCKVSSEETPSNVHHLVGHRPANGDGAGTVNDVPNLDVTERPSLTASGAGLFKTGDDLHLQREDRSSFLDIPWLIEDGLTVLSGPPKTAGKSTFVVHLAACLVSGQRFLEHQHAPVPVVLATDFSPAVVRRLLYNVGVRNGQALNRLHILHPKSAVQRNWRGIITDLYGRSQEVGAPVVIVDSLDQYVYIREGIDPTRDHEVAQILTTDAPRGTSLVAVKALEPSSNFSFQKTVRRLGLLSHAADLVLHLEQVESVGRPSLRRLQARGRTGLTPSTVLCELQEGRYERRRKSDINKLPSRISREPVPQVLPQEMGHPFSNET